VLAVGGLSGNGKDVHVYITGLSRDIDLTGKTDIGARAEELWRRDSRSNTKRSTNEVSDKALAPLASVLTTRVAVVPALDGGSGIVDESV
jgi:hypothetical protein